MYIAIVVFIFLLCELVTTIQFNLWYPIRASGLELLEKELENVAPGEKGSPIYLYKRTVLEASVLEETYSLVFPYAVLSSDGLTYSILRYSKAYYIVRQKFYSPKPKRVKFK